MTSTIAALVLDAERRLAGRVIYRVPQASGFAGVTMEELSSRRRALSAALLVRGVGPGDRVAVIAETRFEWVLADLAILSIGAVTVGVYPTSTPEQIGWIVQHAGCRVAFVAKAAAAHVLPGVEVTILLDDAAASTSLSALEEEGAREVPLRGAELALRSAAVRADDTAAIVYTSGTTGHPKGVVLTHGALCAASRTGIESLGIGEHDVGVGFLPLAHVLARVNFYGTLHAGNETWFSRSMEEVAEVWREARPTVVAVVPRVLEKIQARILAAVASSPRARRALFARALLVGTERARLLDAGRPIPARLATEHALWERLVYRRVRDGLGWSRLRFALCGGAPLRREVTEFFLALGVPVLQGYGLTETSAASIVALPGSTRIGSVGKPLPGIALRVAPDGELLLKGPGLFREYAHDADATRAAFDDEGFFRTGDVGHVDADGFVHITDRKKDLLVTAGGKNIAPQNIEAALLADPRVLQAVVLGEGRPFLVALLVLDPLVADKERAAAEGVERANATLARFEQVKRFALLEGELTIEAGLLTPTQKVRRRAVAERFAPLVEGLYASTPPMTRPDVPHGP